MTKNERVGLEWIVAHLDKVSVVREAPAETHPPEQIAWYLHSRYPFELFLGALLALLRATIGIAAPSLLQTGGFSRAQERFLGSIQYFNEVMNGPPGEETKRVQRMHGSNGLFAEEGNEYLKQYVFIICDIIDAQREMTLSYGTSQPPAWMWDKLIVFWFEMLVKVMPSVGLARDLILGEFRSAFEGEEFITFEGIGLEHVRSYLEVHDKTYNGPSEQNEEILSQAISGFQYSIDQMTLPWWVPRWVKSRLAVGVLFSFRPSLQRSRTKSHTFLEKTSITLVSLVLWATRRGILLRGENKGWSLLNFFVPKAVRTRHNGIFSGLKMILDDADETAAWLIRHLNISK